MIEFLIVVRYIFVILIIDRTVLLVVTEKSVRIDGVNSCTSAILNNLTSSSYSASSVLNNDNQFGPQASMLESISKITASNTAWCPNNPVSDKLSEWLQVDFLSMKIIRNIFTLGREAGNFGEYVNGYYFDYQREDGLTWYRYQDDNHVKIMKGNDDIRNPTHHKFISPVIAKRIRIIPINSRPTKVCFRFILYGCDFKDGVVEYQIPRGHILTYDSKLLNLDDNRYEDTTFSNHTWLQGGMGKIMDDIFPSNLSDRTEMCKFFVAWNKTALAKNYVDLFFRFDVVRVFQTVLLYPMNMPSLSILPFSSLKIEMTNDKSKTSIVKISQQILTADKQVKINLENKEARLVKITLYFKSTWMGLSEVVFNSRKTYTDSVVKPTSSWVEFTSTILPEILPGNPSKLIVPVTLISCFIGTLIIIIIITFIFFFWIRQKKRRRYKSKLCDYRSMIMNDPTYPTHIGNIRTISGKNSIMYNPAESHILGPNSSSTIGYRYIHPPCQDYRTHSNSISNEYEPIDSYWPKALLQGDSLHNSSIDKLEILKLLVSGSSDINNVGPVYCSSSTYSSHPYDSNISIPSTYVTQDTFTDIFNTHIANPLKGLMGSTISCCHLSPVLSSWIDTVISRLCEISPSKLFTQKHVSEGDIGYITSGIIENCEHGVILADIKCNKVNTNFKYTFYKQCFATIKLDFSTHPNLLPIIGKCSNVNICPSILYGYSSQLNLVSFFQKLRNLPVSNDVSFSCNYVSQGSLLYIVKQLADALTFLDDAGIIHRDVSARNCSIKDRFHLILLDFAIGLDEFKDDYISFFAPQCSTISNNTSKSNAVQLPLLWMPWEAIILGNFTTKSDVWSFGVTLWEIFTECQLKPYSVSLAISSSDPSVILKNSMLIANSHPSSILPNGRTIDQSILVQESGIHTDISKHVRDIMHLCWQSNPVLRPNFQTLFSIISELSPELRYADEYGTLHRMIS